MNQTPLRPELAILTRVFGTWLTRGAAAVACALLVAGIATARAAPLGWEQSAGPGKAGVRCLMSHGAFVYAGTSGEGVYRSNDEGTTWTAANAGLEGKTITALSANSAFLFAAVESDMFGNGGVYRSADGANWSPADGGIEGHLILALLAEEGAVYAGDVGNGVYKSTDNGLNWLPANNGMGGTLVQALARRGGFLYAVADNFTYRSDDDAASWTSIADLEYRNLFSFTAGPTLFAGGWNGVARSTDGVRWDFIELPIDGLERIVSFAVSGTTVYAASSAYPGSGVYKSINDGLSWEPANNGLEIVTVDALLLRGTRLLAGTPAKALLASDDGGVIWDPSSTGLPPGGNIRDFLTVGSTVYAATGGDGIYRTVNGGASWEQVSQDDGGLLQSDLVFSLTSSGGALFAGTNHGGAYRSTDSGLHWEQVNNGLPPLGFLQVVSLDAVGPNVIAGTGDGIFYSADLGASWQPTNVSDATIQGLAHGASFAYAIVSTGFFQTTGIYRSANSGQSWQLVFTAGFSTPISIAADGSFAWVGDLLAGAIRSPDNGDSWFDATPESGAGVFSFLPHGDDLYAGLQPNSQMLYFSTTHGASWEIFNEGLDQNLSIEALGAGGDWLFAGTDRRAVWRRSLADPAVVVVTDPAAATLDFAAASPFAESTTLHFRLPQAGPARLALFDASGREVRRLFAGALGAGPQSLALDAQDLPTGTYFARLAASGRQATLRLIRVR